MGCSAWPFLVGGVISLLGGILAVAAWEVEVGELLRRAGELRVIMIDALAVLSATTSSASVATF
jgi:hypothetical protein